MKDLSTGTRAGKDGAGKERAGKEREEKHRRMRWMSPREQGEWAELCFMARAAEERLSPTRPWGEKRYDIGVEFGGRYARVQVKSTVYKRRGESYSLNVMGPGRKPYEKGTIDFVAVFLIPADTWYIVPHERMVRKNGQQCCSIHFTLGGKRQKYGDCREAFWRLRGEEPQEGGVDAIFQSLSGAGAILLLSDTMVSGIGASMGAPRNPGKRRRTKRTVGDLAVYQRSAALANLRRAAEAASPPNFPPASIFSPWAIWGWVKRYLPLVFAGKHRFPTDTGPGKALYDLSGESLGLEVAEAGAEKPGSARPKTENSGAVRISLAGDWGTGTVEAQAVAEHMKAFEPHFTIHLGDVYPVGDARSVNENCLGIRNPSNNYDPVHWPMGSRGGLALNGNHEMFANGSGYFDVFLPALGMMGGEGKALGQPTSFFCLQNDDWRILAVDTGYNSAGVPILSGIPWVNSIPGICGDCRLEESVVEWIKSVVEPEKSRRGLILLSHHQNYSGFEDWYRKPAEQLSEAGIRQPVLWFWGHEHRLAGYDLYGTGGLKSYGRCIGHGGMPVERRRPSREPEPVFYDFRGATNGYGVNGFVNLTLQGRGLVASYVDMDGIEVLCEKFVAAEDGAVRLESRKKVINNPDFPCTDQ